MCLIMIRFGNSCLFNRHSCRDCLMWRNEFVTLDRVVRRSKILFSALPLGKQGRQGSSQRRWYTVPAAAPGLRWLIYRGVFPGCSCSLFHRQPALLHAYSYSPLHTFSVVFHSLWISNYIHQLDTSWAVQGFLEKSSYFMLSYSLVQRVRAACNPEEIYWREMSLSFQ